jgi:hypothetical protein
VPEIHPAGIRYAVHRSLVSGIFSSVVRTGRTGRPLVTRGIPGGGKRFDVTSRAQAAARRLPRRTGRRRNGRQRRHARTPAIERPEPGATVERAPATRATRTRRQGRRRTVGDGHGQLDARRGKYVAKTIRCAHDASLQGTPHAASSKKPRLGPTLRPKTAGARHSPVQFRLFSPPRLNRCLPSLPPCPSPSTSPRSRPC